MLMLRKVEKEDGHLLLDWANDGDVRDMSVNRKTIIWKDHINWLERKLGDSNTKMFILLDGTKEVGQIRLEYREEEWVIGYSIAAECRGKGYGKRIVELALCKIDKGTIIAFVKPSNAASVKIFTDLGFAQTGLTEEQGIELITFRIEKP